MQTTVWVAAFACLPIYLNVFIYIYVYEIAYSIHGPQVDCGFA